MNLDFNVLVNKMLNYWRIYDGKEFTTESLRNYFTPFEIFTFCYDDNFKGMHYFISYEFSKKAKNLKGLFTPAEAAEFKNYLSFPLELVEYYDDETLSSLIGDSDDFISSSVLSKLSSDEARENILRHTKGTIKKVEIISSFESDEMKLKHLREVPIKYKSNIICTLKDEFLKEKFIGIFKGDISLVISSLSSYEKKIKYYKKYYLLLNNDGKASIISSLDNDMLILECLKNANDYVKCEVVWRTHALNADQKIAVLSTVNNKKKLAEVLSHSSFDAKIIMKFIDSISDSRLIAEIIKHLPDSDKLLFLEKCSEKYRLEILKEMYEPDFVFKGLLYITKFSNIVQVLEHAELFPKYIDEYEYLIDLYASNYNLNKDNLLKVVKKVSLGVLRVIKNENIIKLINSNSEDIDKILALFDDDKKNMTSGSMNDILNSLLQREFRIKHSDIVLIFPYFLNAIENNDREFIIRNLELISSNVNLDEELKNYNLNINNFVDLLLQKNENAINILHNLTTKYIRNKRNNFIQDNLESAKKLSTKCLVDKKDKVKYIIDSFPIEFIMRFLPKEKIVRNEFDEDYKFTDFEYEFLKQRDLIEKILLYKKNPSQYEQIPDDVKNNMKIFNDVMLKVFGSKFIRHINDIDSLKKTYEFKKINEDSFVNILMNLDIDKMKKRLLNDPEMYEILTKLIERYKIVGWGDIFSPILSRCGIMVDSEIIANFIQYFDLSYNELKRKVEAGELGSISLTALIDLANCYSKESEKYSLLFGDEDFKLIAGNPGPNSASMVKKDRIAKAINLVKMIRERDYVTVPPVDKDFTLSNGKKMNIVVGNFSNMMNLTYGERTGACMRIGGAGESLFKFCLEDDNGFHIRFVNPQTGALVSRVSGFRNGNTVFLNQLRDSIDSEYSDLNVVEACRLIAEEMIKLSEDSPTPIDNVVVSPHYAMKKSGMPSENIGVSDIQKGMKNFYTDVTSTSIILATSTGDRKLVPVKLGNHGLKKYLVQRDKKKILYDKAAGECVTHLKVVDQILSGVSIDMVTAEVREDILFCYAGEDWCIYVDKNGQIDNFILNNSNNKELAIAEMQEALEYIKNNLSNEINIAQNATLGM